MGTPHRGSDGAYWAGFLDRAIRATQLGFAGNNRLLSSLQANSQALADISAQFVERAARLRIVTFFEREKLGPALVSSLPGIS